jgi:two-component system chemotaxis response regulator CheB
MSGGNPAGGRARVLIVDDSTFMRMVLRRIVEADGDLAVVGEARNGSEAVALARELKPDIITMDVEMPELDGLTATRKILAEATVRPTILMVSIHTQEGADTTIRALHAGAADFVSKSSAFATEDLGHVDKELREKLAFWAQRRRQPPQGVPLTPPPAPAQPARIASAPPVAVERPLLQLPRARVDLVVVAASTGGPQTLPLLLRGATPLGAPMVVAQHMPEHFTRSLAELLRTESGLDVREGEHRMSLGAGTVTIIPGGRDAVVAAVPAGYELRLASSEALVHPSADMLFEAAAMVGRQPVGVVLTGMGEDGTRGAAQLRRRHLPVLVQDPQTCVVSGMPTAAIAAGVATEALDPLEIGRKLSRWTSADYSPRTHNTEPQ